MIKITEAIAIKVRDTVAAGLSSGLGKPKPGEMCVEAAVCYALGLPHGDDPGCVSAPLRALKIRLNDAAWSSNQARAEGLKRLALAQLGSAGVLDDQEFRRLVDQPDPPVDPAEHAAHALIDALTDLEKAIATATTLERAHQLKAMLKRAYTQVNAVDLKASAKIDQLVEQRR